MKRDSHIRNRFILGADLVLILLTVLLSFVLRLELVVFWVDYRFPAFLMAMVALVIKPLVYYYFGLYRRLWIYASIQELRVITVAVTVASGLVTAVTYGLWTWGAFGGFPRSVWAIDWLLSLLMVGGLRFSIRMLTDVQAASRPRRGQVRRLLVVGAGDAGALVVREMQKSRQVNLLPVGFLDDDPAKQGHRIYDVPVLGVLDELTEVVKFHQVNEVIIAIPSAPGSVVRLVADACRKIGVPFRTIPGLDDLIGGRVKVNRLREVEITDLLRREPARIDDQLVGESLIGKHVLITGAGGSIGGELCRQVARREPAGLVLLGHGENSIFEVLLEMKDIFPSLPMHPVIADIRDLSRLQAVFDRHRPEMVFHAAAHKHVPLMEVNVEEAVTNNVLGTRNVIAAAQEGEVERLVMITTDKAIRPSTVMGATKRIAEMLVLDAARRSGESYSVVRFGNVLGSRGSVVPRFKRQIANGGPVTITHPDMERYFMTIPEAVHLVLQASAMGQGGEVFVLKMGEQVRILNMAEDLIRLSGLEPGVDIEIVYTGIRPGEKLSEDLWEETAEYQETAHPDVMRQTNEEFLSGQDLDKAVDDMIRLAGEGDSQAIVDLLDALIPGAMVRSTPPMDFSSLI